jgi:amino acid adenylation domain-containing protein
MPESFLLNKEILDNFSLFQKNFRSITALKIAIDNQSITTTLPAHTATNFIIDPALFNAVELLAKKHNVQPKVIFLAAFKALLQRYSGQEDFFLTLSDHQENNTASFKAIRSRFNSSISFTALVKLLQTVDIAHGESLTFNRLQEFSSKVEANTSVFQTLFSYNQAIDDQLINNHTAKFKDLQLGLFINQQQSAIYYNTALFTHEFVGALLQHYILLLSGVVEQPDKSIGAHQILTPAEWKEIVIDFNDTVTPYPEQQTLFGLFEERVIALPGSIALRKGDKTITYYDLNLQANRLAHFLIGNGVVPGDNIGLLTGRDFDMIIGMLGILKAGGAYVPIDPDYPIDRQEYIYSQSALKLVIADKNYPLKSLLNEGDFIQIQADELIKQPGTNPQLDINSRQLAYAIYTSGSTGRPKGVMIAHHSAVNLVLWVNKQYHVGPYDNLLFITSMCFDLSVYDIFGMLAAGGSVVIAEQHQVQDVKQLQKMLIDYNITFWDSVPTTLDYLVRNLEQTNPGYNYAGLKTVFMSGDWIPVDLPDRIKKFMPNTQVISLGGATEGTVWSNYYPVRQTLKRWKSIPYGKPIANNFFYILNDQLQPVPQGVTGDLYIGGVGVARGYANDNVKTNASFIADPFNSGLGGMMYKTGDLGRMGTDMNMEFIGRKDNQVKISGFRVELGEIESVLNSYELVTSAVVLAKNDPEGKKRLLAYIVAAGKFDKEALTAYLKTKLPYYMVPALWIQLDHVPLTANGKIDRNALPNIAEPVAAKKVLQPSTATEKTLKAIWLDCLGLSDISIDDNFFELGGHSLIAAQILSAFKNQTGHNLQLAILFQYPDIQSLATFIDSNTKAAEIDYTCLVPIKPTGSKTPLYIIHGEGLNVLKFSTLATNADPDQPIWGLQARGLNGIDAPMNDMKEIAKDYLDEILRHNPNGPYILGGYSFGGYVAVEMHRLLEKMGKAPDMLIMFDTDTERLDKKSWLKLLPQKIKRNIPRFFTYIRSGFIKTKGEFTLPSKNLSDSGIKAFYDQIKNIQKKHLVAFNNYQMTPFNAKVYLFKADISVHYVADKIKLGWARYANNGVEVFEVPGDHRSMLEQPNATALAALLQQTLNKHNH